MKSLAQSPLDSDMAQILDPLPSNSSGRILCCYVNATSHIQIARITNVPNWYFERVVFPGQRLVFEAIPQATLEIHTGSMASAIIADNIPCDRLQIDQQSISYEDKPLTLNSQSRNFAGKRNVKPEPLTTPALTSVD
ncbi:conserved hypothetical protein [Planktothrix paucivesiculata PCC 9631]|uniref:DUF1830 domain-containing protein n=2 Tax=Planktothrix TaxID=54304 RepID=A0A7Z9E367_9CYAN|nr:conserved hypothetical protein [Planktothrix paucivesiculata PCC 9631]